MHAPRSVQDGWRSFSDAFMALQWTFVLTVSSGTSSVACVLAVMEFQVPPIQPHFSSRVLNPVPAMLTSCGASTRRVSLSGKCIDVDCRSGASNGANIFIQDCDDCKQSSSQLWEVIEADRSSAAGALTWMAATARRTGPTSVPGTVNYSTLSQTSSGRLRPAKAGQWQMPWCPCKLL